VTFKDLQRLVESQPDYNNPQHSELERLRGKAFWHWGPGIHRVADKSSKGDCCFNHIISLPKKDGVEKPLFDYEREIYWALTKPGYFNSVPQVKHHIPYDNMLHSFKEKHLWIKKATGLGVTEFMLRFMAWLCVRNDDYRGVQIVIVTGPNIELAIKLIKRMKGLFLNKLGVTFDSKETVLELNGCSIEAYPSNHIDAFRSLTNPKFILIEEGDYFRKNEQDDVRHVAERYIAKSDPFIVMVSTPKAPDGLFDKIEKELFEKCIYKKMFLDYTYGLDKIYTPAEIEKAKQSPSFPREYELQYQGLIGNVFSQLSIENATKIRMLRNQ
jgi:hypothetical protein